jgi:hypothetical protein
METLPSRPASPPRKQVITADAFVQAGTLSLGGIRYAPPDSNQKSYAVWMELIRSVHDAKELSSLAQALV